MDATPEPDKLHTGFALFELPIVALPDELIPLHIFEPRYLAMIEHCVRQDREFGIVWNDGDEPRAVGCACRVDEIVTTDEFKTLDIVARGVRPLVVVERQAHLKFPAGIVTFPGDVEGSGGAEIKSQAQNAYLELVLRASNREPQPEQIAAMNAFAMAATVDLGCELKQELLELRSERLRLELVARAFRAANKRLEFVEEAQAKARSNGKVRIV